MFSHLLVSLANTRRKIYAWFHKLIDTMPDPWFYEWTQITTPKLIMEIHLVLYLFKNAASLAASAKSPTHQGNVVIDRLKVVWVWLNKTPDAESLEHEYIIVETKDSVDEMTRLFVIDRLPATRGASARPENPVSAPEQSKGASSYQRLSNTLFPPSPLSLMEEGILTSTSTSTTARPPLPPVTDSSSLLSMGDTLSLSAAKASQSVSDSLYKADKTDAYDRILGEDYIQKPRYGCGQNARQIKPFDLSFYELVVLAQVVHELAPHYSTFDKNCFWFGNMILDAIIEISGTDNPQSTSPASEDDDRINKFRPIDPFYSDISGRWMGWKITHTKKEDLQQVIHDFKIKWDAEINEVNFFFLLNYYSLLNFEQIFKSNEIQSVGSAVYQRRDEDDERGRNRDNLLRRRRAILVDNE
jgi:hypothetical protein